MITQAAVAEYMPASLVGIVDGYLRPQRMRSREIARSGYVELWPLITDNGSGLYGALEGGYVELAAWLIQHRYAPDTALRIAARYGRFDIAEACIKLGARDLNGALMDACEAGHVATAKMLVDQGASARNLCATIACKHGHGAIRDMLFLHGADYCHYCGLPKDRHY